MNLFRHAFLVFAVTLPLAPVWAADQPNAAEQKLRESLRNTMLQMRTLQTERDTLQADKEALEGEKKELTQKLDVVTKESTANQAANEKIIAETRDRLALREEEKAKLGESLKKWEAAHKEVSAQSAAREAARAKLYSEKVVLERTVADQQRKNQEMYKLGIEILNRYEGFGLGTALTAREPFVGISRIKLQNWVQDYSEKLGEQKIRPGATPAPAPETSTTVASTAPASGATSAPRKLDPPSRKPQQGVKKATPQ